MDGRRRAEELLERARADPLQVIDEGPVLLESLPSDQFEERAIVLRALSVATRIASRVDESIGYARRAAEVAVNGDLDEQRWMALLTLAGSYAVKGDMALAMEVIDGALDQCSDPQLRARFQFQRGYVEMTEGRSLDALSDFRESLPTFEDSGDRQSVLLTLQNVGRVLVSMGDLDSADESLGRALAIASADGNRSAVAGIEQNLGLSAAYRGDIPAALARLTRSDELFMELSGDDSPQHVARCEVLISAGLFEEAVQLATTIAERNRALNDIEHLGNALLVAARASLHSGSDPEATVHFATEALETLRRADRDPVAAEAELLLAQARHVAEGASPELVRSTQHAVELLDSNGLLVAADQARLLCAFMAAEIGDIDTSESELDAVKVTRSGPVEMRIQRSMTVARLRIAKGDKRGASAAILSGLRLLDQYQAALGATELRMGIERQGWELIEMGLDLAVDAGRPRRVLDWLDRSRAQSLRYPPVTPSDHDETQSLLVELRRVEAELRESSVSSRDLAAKRRRLQERIAQVERSRVGSGRRQHRASVDQLIDRLTHRTLIEFGEKEGRVICVRVRGRRASLIELGPLVDALSELQHVRFAMRRAARRGALMRWGALDHLDQILLGDIGQLSDEVVIVPPPSLMSVPWAALPSLVGRSLSVCPSVEMWARAVGTLGREGRIAVAGGPDLAVAESEVESVAAMYENADLHRPGATVAEVKASLQGSAVAHIACHATFSVENPMFSSLRLGDGDLNVYDIERLGQPPTLVVLSACDSGYTETREGIELAGLTSAFLSMGTKSVVASVGLVPDSPATSDLMVDFHKGLVAGLEPAAALAAAQEKAFEDPERFVSAASFICVGA